MVFEGFYAAYGILLPIWMGAVGWALWRLGGRQPGSNALSSPLGEDAPE
jgi:hypothetical protein